MPTLRWVLFLVATAAAAQEKSPILDMHMHARTASFYGKPPLRMCAPVERMPRWDQRKPMWEDGSPPPCKPIFSPMTDAELFRDTIATMERHNAIGVLGGSPELVGEWMKAAPGASSPVSMFASMPRPARSSRRCRAARRGASFR